MTDIVYLNGEFMPLEAARVPVLDRGFIFGDGVYEVIPVYSRHPFRLPEHLRRLQHSLDGIRLANPMSDAEWTKRRHLVLRKESTRSVFQRQKVTFDDRRFIPRRNRDENPCHTYLFTSNVAASSVSARSS